jgi:hypothetical protein
MYQDEWTALYPDKPWPGAVAAMRTMGEEIQALRLLTDSVVTTCLEDEGRRRSVDEIQRAHDLVGQYCHEMDDAATFHHVSALCWVLRHDHNTVFGQILQQVEDRLERMGIRVVRLPHLQQPDQER